MAGASLDRLRRVMVRLRDPVAGCDWDRVQTFASIAPYTIEEAYEVADACARGDLDDLKDELGDLLLQIVFHARMAQEIGVFDFDDVATAIADKMERRHPHIFGAAVASPGWETIKAAERAGKPDQAAGALAGVALGLPALLRAVKLQKRAARTGFDWPDATGPRAKVIEEIVEIDTATPETREEEFGDLLFAVANWARHHAIDPEAALRRANEKFETRFAGMEALAGDAFPDLDLEQKESLWRRVKGDVEGSVRNPQATDEPDRSPERHRYPDP